MSFQGERPAILRRPAHPPRGGCQTGEASMIRKMSGAGNGVTLRRAKPPAAHRVAKSSSVRSRPPTLTSMLRSLR